MNFINLDDGSISVLGAFVLLSVLIRILGSNVVLKYDGLFELSKPVVGTR